LANRSERFHLERGAADERTVDVGPDQQLGRILGLDGAAIEDGNIEQRLDERVRVLRLLGGRGLTRANRPDGLVRDDEPLAWTRSTRLVCPDSRSSSDSPTHAITRRSCSRAANARRATVSSVSPKYCRRSECPMIAPFTPSSRNIAAETSPVYAPSVVQ
jgi:hypothetical protein